VSLLLALDEAGRTPIPRLDEMVSTIGGRGMSELVYVQDLGQLEAAYGREEAQTIRGNCHNQLYYRPSDHDTAAHISRMCGQTSVEDVRISGTFGEERSYGQRPRELITPDEVRQMPHEHVIVFAGRKPPMMAHRLEWFNLFHDAQERVASAPPSDLPELPRPEISVGNANPRTAQRSPKVRVGHRPTCRSSRVGSAARGSAKRGRGWAATSNRTYEPAENRRGVLATLALIGALVALSALMFAAFPGRGGDLGGLAPRPGDGDPRARSAPRRTR
jgi:hypothetical protein